MRLICQPLANSSVTGLTAHPLPLPVFDILTLWLQLELNKTECKLFFTPHLRFLPLCLLVKKTPQSFLLKSFLDFSLFLAQKCQGHSLLKLLAARFFPQAGVPPHWDFCPVCLSGLSCGHMPNTIAQAVFLIC